MLPGHARVRDQMARAGRVAADDHARGVSKRVAPQVEGMRGAGAVRARQHAVERGRPGHFLDPPLRRGGFLLGIGRTGLGQAHRAAPATPGHRPRHQQRQQQRPASRAAPYREAPQPLRLPPLLRLPCPGIGRLLPGAPRLFLGLPGLFPDPLRFLLGSLCLRLGLPGLLPGLLRRFPRLLGFLPGALRLRLSPLRFFLGLLGLFLGLPGLFSGLIGLLGPFPRARLGGGAGVRGGGEPDAQSLENGTQCRPRSGRTPRPSVSRCAER